MRRVQVLGCLALVSTAFVVGCSSSQEEAKAAGRLRFQDRPARAGRDVVLVLTPFAPSAHAMWTSLREEVADSLDVVTVEMTDWVTSARLKLAIDRTEAKCVVLVGNQAVQAYRELQGVVADTPPAIVAMSSFAKQVAGDLRRTSGVAYEVPAVTSFVMLRQLSTRPLVRVGVLHRPGFGEFVAHERELAAREKFELVGLPIAGDVGPRKIRLGLRELVMRQNVEALWVLNDNGLLSASAIRDGWLPEVRRLEVPVLVGVSNLVNASLSFGSVAVVPDHGALGVQVANLLLEQSDEDWEERERDFELPLSVQTVVDMNQERLIGLKPEAFEQIDRPVSQLSQTVTL